MSLRDTIIEFYEALESVESQFEEVQDTGVREQLSETVYHYFVYNHEAQNIPITYGMFSKKGDDLVHAAVKDFLKSAKYQAQKEGIFTPEDRHDFLQDPTIKTAEGSMYDEYLGHSYEIIPDESIPLYRFSTPTYKLLSDLQEHKEGDALYYEPKGFIQISLYLIFLFGLFILSILLFVKINGPIDSKLTAIILCFIFFGISWYVTIKCWPHIIRIIF